MQSNRELEKEVDGFWHFCLGTVNSNWNDQHSNKIAAKPFSEWLIAAPINKETSELVDPAIFVCTITILSTIFKFNWFVDGFLILSLVPAHLPGCLAGAQFWCWTGLCTSLHFIFFADTQKQGAAWWPGCHGSRSLRLQLLHRSPLSVTLQILHWLNCNLISRLLCIGLTVYQHANHVKIMSQKYTQGDYKCSAAFLLVHQFQFMSPKHVPHYVFGQTDLCYFYDVLLFCTKGWSIQSAESSYSLKWTGGNDWLQDESVGWLTNTDVLLSESLFRHTRLLMMIPLHHEPVTPCVLMGHLCPCAENQNALGLVYLQRRVPLFFADKWEL